MHNMTEHEKQFLILRDQYANELYALEKQIDDLEERRQFLAQLLDGQVDIPDEDEESAEDDGTELSDDEICLDYIVSEIKKVKNGVSKATIKEWWTSGEITNQDLDRILKKGKRRGVIRNEGRGRASLWYYVK